jgi:hypothetical protein
MNLISRIYYKITDKKFIARSRLRYILGTGVIGALISAVNLLTFAKVWENTFLYYGIPPIAVYFILPVFYIAACWYIGFIYDTRGIWGEETSHSNEYLNPEFKKLVKDIKQIKDKLGIEEEKPK